MAKEREKLYDCIEDKIKTLKGDIDLLEEYDQQALKVNAITVLDHCQVYEGIALLRKAMTSLVNSRTLLDQFIES